MEDPNKVDDEFEDLTEDLADEALDREQADWFKGCICGTVC